MKLYEGIFLSHKQSKLKTTYSFVPNCREGAGRWLSNKMYQEENYQDFVNGAGCFRSFSYNN